MSWVYLATAIGFEVVGTTLMKFTEGFTRILPSAGVIIFYVISTVMLNLALKEIDISIAYAIWSAVGTAAIAVIGFLWFKEPMGAVKMLSIFLIIMGVVGLNLSSRGH